MIYLQRHKALQIFVLVYYIWEWMLHNILNYLYNLPHRKQHVNNELRVFKFMSTNDQNERSIVL